MFIFLWALTMAINPVRIDYLTVCCFIHSQNKFCIQVNIFSETVENLFSAGQMNENTFKTYKLQHVVYSRLYLVLQSKSKTIIIFSLTKSIKS
jgi:hypothetical protein